jgi:hypothetical protein
MLKASILVILHCVYYTTCMIKKIWDMWLNNYSVYDWQTNSYTAMKLFFKSFPSKQKWSFRARSVVQVAEHVPSNHRILSSNSSAAKKKKSLITGFTEQLSNLPKVRRQISVESGDSTLKLWIFTIKLHYRQFNKCPLTGSREEDEHVEGHYTKGYSREMQTVAYAQQRSSKFCPRPQHQHHLITY